MECANQADETLWHFHCAATACSHLKPDPHLYVMMAIPIILPDAAHSGLFSMPLQAGMRASVASSKAVA